MSRAASPRAPDRFCDRGSGAALLGIAAVVAAQFALVKPTNFGGFDEWVILSLVGRGIADVPHANRPFELLWSLPASLGPPSLWTYYATHTAYLAALGGLAFLLSRRLHPGEPLLAFLAGVFAAAWAPMDLTRLNVVVGYAGLAFSAFLALLLLVESWRTERPVLLMLGALVGFLNMRGYEASAGLLVGAPILLAWGNRRRRLLAWCAAWEAAMLLAVALVALPLLSPSRMLAYQAQILGGLDLHPLAVLGRLAEQYRHHLLPLVATPPSELAEVWVAVAVAAFTAAFWLAAQKLRAGADAEPALERVACARLMALGLLLAGLGYGVLVLTSRLSTASRMQFLSAPGIGLFLASFFGLLASFAAPRLRRRLLWLLGAWVVAVGTGRTAAMQSQWDRIGFHPFQDRVLSWLSQKAPHFRPNTFVVLIDEGSTFQTTFSFRHALSYLYHGEATGYVWGKPDLLYPARFTRAGIESLPWPELREAWQAPVTFHRYDEVVVLRQTYTGALQLMEEWPEDPLPPLPAEAVYAPRARIVEGAPPRQHRILRGTREPSRARRGTTT